MSPYMANGLTPLIPANAAKITGAAKRAMAQPSHGIRRSTPGDFSAGSGAAAAAGSGSAGASGVGGLGSSTLVSLTCATSDHQLSDRVPVGVLRIHHARDVAVVHDHDPVADGE